MEVKSIEAGLMFQQKLFGKDILSFQRIFADLGNQIYSMKRILLFSLLLFCACAPDAQVKMKKTQSNDAIVTGAERTDQYLALLKGKRVAIVGNQTSILGEEHLVDALLSLDINIVKVFSPEHGFRGNAAAGEKVQDGMDKKTGLPIISLYGKNKKPSREQLADVDLVIFDIQDVGARFYTYISTMHYVMEAVGEENLEVLVLDRPNPNGFYVDGPMLKAEFKSFVGMHPIPVVHGLTVGELAQMINQEGWLKNQVKCELTVIPCENYSHLDLYTLPVSPSPNLPNMTSIYLYPSLCFFEGTKISIGRGTEHPFQIIGYPDNPVGRFEFTPEDIPGVANNPKHENNLCQGHDLRQFGSFYFTTGGQLYLDWLLGTYEGYSEKSTFFTGGNFIDKLAGSDQLRKDIIAGKSAQEIKNSWKDDLGEYKIMRKKYLLYTDFE